MCFEEKEKHFERLKNAIDTAEAIVIGAGTGLSASAGLDYSGARFEEYFSDFGEKYGFDDMYSGEFYPFPTEEEFWAYWSRNIYVNRYMDPPRPVYRNLYRLVRNKEYFIITANVDHCFQKAGFDNRRIFYTQGDYGLLQCSTPCHMRTYDNETLIRKMAETQKDMRIPHKLLPRCPKCGKPMTINLRSNDKFVQDEGWYQAAERYDQFLYKYQGKHILFLELGVGYHTPEIIKYPFWRMTANNRNAIYACLNLHDTTCPMQLLKRAICIQEDVGMVIERLLMQTRYPSPCV